MIDVLIWWVGAATLAAGAVGVVSLVLIWSLNKVIRLLGFNKALLAAYRQHITNQRDARNSHAPDA